MVVIGCEYTFLGGGGIIHQQYDRNEYYYGGFPECTVKILKVSIKLNLSTSSNIKMVFISARIEEEKMMERGISGIGSCRASTTRACHGPCLISRVEARHY